MAASGVQVCGNFESVRKLRQWLRDWADSIDRETRDAPPRNVPGKRQRGRGRGGACSDDSDDDSDGGASLNPAVILLHGPPGCGKSAAVAACARELGFKRIEVNPASDRSGAHLHRLIGEATKSRNIPGRAAAQKSAGDKVAAMFGALRGPVVGAEAAGLGILVGRRAGGGQGAREAGKTVVVLEEVDVLLEEDRGFAGALAQLMQETKRPMVLTASTATPACLPAGLGVRTVRFGRPSVDEVLETLVVACAALCEVPPRLEDVEVLAAESGGDVRKAIHAAQLWLSGDGRGARAHERCGGGSAGSASGALESAWGAVATMGLGAAEQGASARKVAEAGKGGGDVSEEMSRVERELERRVLDRLAETAPHVTKRRGGRDALAMMQARTGQR